MSTSAHVAFCASLRLYVRLAAGRTPANVRSRNARASCVLSSPGTGVCRAVYVEHAASKLPGHSKNMHGEDINAIMGADEDAVISLVVAAQITDLVIKLDQLSRGIRPVSRFSRHERRHNVQVL